jgi:hypothetical protein
MGAQAIWKGVSETGQVSLGAELHGTGAFWGVNLFVTQLPELGTLVSNLISGYGSVGWSAAMFLKVRHVESPCSPPRLEGGADLLLELLRPCVTQPQRRYLLPLDLDDVAERPR